ncbi:hypothetical protein LZ32DRAFT_383870 [Colletotrichum eremochloae]|nr:hypothetical protein LZ32DRAFT_383870 [Colletotrichum eremochloae]
MRGCSGCGGALSPASPMCGEGAGAALGECACAPMRHSHLGSWMGYGLQLCSDQSRRWRKNVSRTRRTELALRNAKPETLCRTGPVQAYEKKKKKEKKKQFNTKFYRVINPCLGLRRQCLLLLGCCVPASRSMGVVLGGESGCFGVEESGWMTRHSSPSRR